MKALLANAVSTVPWRSAAGYLLIEAVMPGGTLVAFLLYLYRSRHARRA
jgi:hypothetical protein